MQNHKFHIACFFTIVVVFILAINTKASFSIESVSAQTSLEEIQRDRFQFLQDKWKAYWCSLTQIKASSTYRRFSQGKTIEEHDTEFEAYYPYKSNVRKSSCIGSETVSVVGPRYSFELLREKADEQWTILTLFPNTLPQDSIKDWKFPTPYEKSSRNKIVGYDIYNTLGVGLQTGCIVSLPSLFALDELELRKLEYVTLDGQEFLYMDVGFRQKGADAVDNRGAQSSQEDVYRIDGEVWLDTESFLIAKRLFAKRSIRRK